MKKKMKFLFLLASAFLSLSAVGCSKSKVVVDTNTINIKMNLGGYGRVWMDTLIEKFETVYKDKGYKVNLLKPSSTNQGNAIVNELVSGYAKNKIDIYFTASVSVKSVVDGDYGCLVEDLTDLVYNQTPISFSGKEENTKIIDKLDSSFGESWYQYNGKDYNFFYEKSVGALVVNKDKLSSFGLELPVTTDELLNCVRTIYQKKYNHETAIAPFTYIGSGTNGYSQVMMNSWFTQLSGIEGWDRFWSMDNEDGSYDKENGYKVFEDTGLHKAAELVYTLYDQKNFTAGAANNDLSSAHADIMSKTSGAVFMFDGDWMLNECAVDYSKEDLEKLAFINVPVASDVGVRLWGDTLPEEECDEILSSVIHLLDDNKSTGEIIHTIAAEEDFEISESDVETVSKARGVFNNRGVETGNAYIPTGLDETHKTIASLFLRMLASDDFASMYETTAHCASPYAGESVSASYEYEFQEGHAAIVNHKDATGIWPLAQGLRSKIGALGEMFPICGTQIHAYAAKSTITEYTGGTIDPSKAGYYRTASEAMLATEYSNITKNWNNWVKDL